MQGPTSVSLAWLRICFVPQPLQSAGRQRHLPSGQYGQALVLSSSGISIQCASASGGLNLSRKPRILRTTVNMPLGYIAKSLLDGIPYLSMQTL